jgi:hypothetical protein
MVLRLSFLCARVQDDQFHRQPPIANTCGHTPAGPTSDRQQDHARTLEVRRGRTVIAPAQAGKMDTFTSEAITMKQPSLAAAKKKLADAKKSKPKDIKEWAKVIKTAESILKSAGIKS